VIFGGSGFLGSHVADALTAAGHSVRIFDINESPYLRPGQEMVVGDILDLNAVASAARGADVVYNFAGLADIDEAKNKPIESVHLNVLGNVHMLEACRLNHVPRYVFASTVYVYSESGSFYRASKQACERYIEAFHQRYGQAYTILRYGSLYGRRADRRNGIFRMLHSALVDGKIVYSGTGQEQREYIHVNDAAEASVRVLEPEFENQHVVLTGAHPYKVQDVMRMISELLGDKPEIICENKPIEGHYKITPYAFHPRVGKKLVSDTLADIHERLNPEDETVYGVIIPHDENRGPGDDA
jgi:UDP-glucose 4-epimerase